ncbi:hypothetical protein JCGZ_14979 [Jatropha curcas]|uniref:Uncharacterized protein n=1 Tax=Jatropha curcas TaxID=180498 RepID=A0A067K6P1_JATCU|nr:hypothetical protein JCGZ_14979 [Jatropha curcas]
MGARFGPTSHPLASTRTSAAAGTSSSGHISPSKASQFRRLPSHLRSESQRRVPYFDLGRTTHYNVPRILPDDWPEYPIDEPEIFIAIRHLQTNLFDALTWESIVNAKLAESREGRPKKCKH